MSGLNDIDKIKNFINKVEILANGENSKDNNGVIDNPKEWSIFNQEIEKAPKEDQIMLLGALNMPEVKQEAKPDGKTPVGTPNPGEGLSKSEKKGSRDFILKRLDSFVSKYYQSEKIDYNDLIEDSFKDTKGEYYKMLKDATVEVANLIPKENLTSKEAIEKAADEIENNIEKNGEKNGEEKEVLKFKKQVLKKFVQMEAARQKDKEYLEMSNRFTELRNEGKTRQEAYKTIKQEFGGKGSYYEDILSTGFMGLHDTEFKKKTVRGNAREQVYDSLGKQMTGADGPQNRKEVKDNVKEDLGEDYDKYARYYTNGRDRSSKDKVNFENSDFKNTAKTVGSKNRGEKVKRDGFTREELESAFSHKFLGIGPKHSAAIEMLKTNGFIEEATDEKGNKIYKPTQKLMDIIELHTGYHNVLDKQEKDDNALSEVKNLRDAILTDMEGNDKVKFTDRDVIALAKLCGFDYNGKNFVKDLWQTGPAALINAGAGVGSTVATGIKKLTDATLDVSGLKPYIFNGEIPITIEIVNDIEVNLTFPEGTSAEAMQRMASQFGLEWSSVTVNGTTITAQLEQIKKYENLPYEISLELGINPEDIGVDVKQGETKIDRKKALAYTAAYTMAMWALQAAMKDSGELPVTATQFDKGTTYDQYIRQLNKEEKLTGDQKQALGSLANLYVLRDADGNPQKDEKGNIKWNSEAYRQKLNKIAGNKSVLNKAELQTWADLQLKNFKPDDVKTDDQTKVEELTKKNEELQNALDDCEKQPKADTTPEPDGEKWVKDYSGEVDKIEKSARYGWVNLGRMWDCCNNLTDKEARRVIQVIQAIDPNEVQGVYNIDRILDIAHDVFGENCLKPHVAGREQELKDKYPELDIGRLRAAYNATVSADEKGIVTAPLELVDNKGNKYQRKNPQRETTRYTKEQLAQGKIDVAKTKRDYSGTKYWIQKPGKEPQQVSKEVYDASKYKLKTE